MNNIIYSPFVRVSLRRRRGLTLIEILIAIIVLLIGVVGVLALFPAAIRTAKFSIEDSISAEIGESVADALTIAMRSALPEKVKKDANGVTNGVEPGEVELIHDGISTNLNKYRFALPMAVSKAPDKVRFFAHPAKDPMNGSTPVNIPSDVFMLGNSEHIKKVIDKIGAIKSDSLDPYNQYAFAFTVSRMDDTRDMTLPETDYVPTPLYQFAISIYRLPADFDRANLNKEKPLKVFVLLLSGKVVYVN